MEINRYYPQREQAGFLVVDSIDVVQIKANSKDPDPIDPAWTRKEAIDIEDTKARTLSSVNSRSRQTDTSQWLG